MINDMMWWMMNMMMMMMMMMMTWGEVIQYCEGDVDGGSVDVVMVVILTSARIKSGTAECGTVIARCGRPVARCNC
jgi:hypothetical protein